MTVSRRLWAYILLPVLIIAAHSIGVLKPIERGIIFAALPVKGAFFRFGLSVKNFARSEFEKREIQKESERLKSEIVKLYGALAAQNELEAEVGELRGLLNFQKRTSARMLVAGVSGERTIGAAKMLLINRGSLDGVAKDLPVVSQDGVLVGKILEVKEKISLVLILLDRRSRVAATIQNKDGTIGIVEGGYGLSSSMKFIPQSEKVEADNLVITSGLEETVPRGLLVGIVESVAKDVREPFQEATIKPLADFENLITVAVILPSL